MSRRMRGRPDPEPPDPPSIPPDRAIVILKRQADRAEALIAQPTVEDSAYEAWQNDTREYLTQAFGRGADNVSRVVAEGRLFSFGEGGDYTPRYKSALRGQVALLNGCIEQLQERLIIWKTSAPPGTPSLSAPGQDVFVVHGHDEGTKQMVARVLEKVRLRPIILHEQPDKGRTIIEKFEAHAPNAGYAVVIVTGDDLGRLHPGKNPQPPEVERPRARQNVILEWGYFLGRLGRERVAALCDPGVELPSDYSGVLVIRLGDDTWQFRLAKEMKAAGLRVDLNDL